MDNFGVGIDKALYQAPVGVEELATALLAQNAAPMEIEVAIEGEPEVVAEGEVLEVEAPFEANLAEYLPEGVLQSLSSDILDFVNKDVRSRKDWETTYEKGIELLGLKYEERSEPWEGACGAVHPLLAEAVVRFQAETIMETFPAAGPVKTQIIGKETREKQEASSRVKDDMNYRLTEQMKEYRAEHEKLLWSLPSTGSAFKKVYYDPSLQRPVALFVPAEDLILPYGHSDLNTSPRFTHRMKKTKNELKKLQVAGFYRDVDLGEPVPEVTDITKKKDKETGMSALQDDRYTLFEVHIDYDLEGYEDTDDDGEPTGIALPYVITIDKGTGEVLSVRRNWRPDDPLKSKRMHFVHYMYIPGDGAYGYGLIHLVGGFAKSATSLLRQLVDAGTLSNLPGGLKSRGLRIKGDDTPIAPGEFRDVDVPGQSIKDNIMLLPYREPSQTLAGLMDKIVEEGRRFAAVSDLNISDMSQQAPVGTTLALLERTLKTMSAVMARVHFAMKNEFQIIAGIVRDFTPETYGYEPETGTAQVKQADYDSTEVIPVSDPNASTMSQRVVQYQAAFQMAQAAPQIYDQQYLHRQMLEILGIKNAAKIVPVPDDMVPKDPVTENMDVMNGKPLKAFMHQDHRAHLAVHQNMIQDPVLMQTLGQNPQAQKMQAALMAHINEHMAFQYRKDIEARLGVPLPPPEEPLPAEIEVSLSALIAQASQQMLAQNVQQAQAQQAQQQAQDPVVQMQQKELAIKEAEVKRKADKDAADVRLGEQKLQLDTVKVMGAAMRPQQPMTGRGNV